MINANEKGDCQEFVMHGSNISGAVKINNKKSITDKNVIKTFKDC